ncbi:MAG: GNAT family N-acetyltransferase [Microcystaceae cyanobacterium]
MNEQRWQFLPLEKQHQREAFDCGNPVLNDYLKKYARQNHKKGIAKTFVAISAAGEQKIAGYYTLSASVIEFNSLPSNYQKKLPAYPIPALLIGKLAVDKSVQGQGLGSELLVNALLRSVKTAQEIGIFAVRVDAIDDNAKAFYLKHEFIPFQDTPFSLFLPISSLSQLHN